jgi:hypothetical protein
VAIIARLNSGLSAIDANPHGEIGSQLKVEYRHRFLHRQPAPHCSLGVVVVRARNAEGDHHRVADELLNRAAMQLGDGLHPLKIASHLLAQNLWVGLGAEGGKAD